MMKQFIFLGLVTMNVMCSAQKAGQPSAMAYAREVLGGARKTERVSDNGVRREVVPQPSYQYLFFFAAGSKANARPLHLFLNGRYHELRAEKVASPLIVPNTAMPDAKPDTLVPAGLQNVFQLQLQGTPAAGTGDELLQKLIRENELVVVYEVDGKEKYLPVKVINKLSPLIMQ